VFLIRQEGLVDVISAEDVMSEPDFINVDAAVEKAAEELASAENTLVVREDGEFVGLEI